MRKNSVNSFLSKAMLLLMPFSFMASSLTLQQQHYLDARDAQIKQKRNDYQVLRQKLGEYPLNIYLDYHDRIGAITAAKGDSALQQMEHFNHSPLYNMMRYRYLLNAGTTSRWSDFLVISPDSPNDIKLQCFYYRALLATNNKQAAYKGAEKLWLYGRSRPTECNPLFEQWTKEGYRTQALLWSRMLLSFNDGQSGLLSYLSRSLTKHKQEATLINAVYNDPNILRNIHKFSGSKAIVGDIVAVGLRKLASKNLNQAINLYVKYKKIKRFGPLEEKQLNHYLVRRALITQNPSYKPHIDAMLSLLGADDLLEMRLRWAIKEQDDATTNKFLPLLSEQGKLNPRWQYWQATMTAKSDEQLANKLMTTLSKERNFYGFMAAQQLNLPYAMNDDGLTVNPELYAKLSDDQGLARIIELKAIDKEMDARVEWVHLMRRHKPEMVAQYGLLAIEKGWYDLSVEASIQGLLWDALPLRFPDAQPNAFAQASKRYGVDIDEIRAISRRESAFYRYATSGVGARGLMQLMPATAKETAQRNGLTYRNEKDLYQPELNVMLGSAYYKQLLKRYNNNRVLATAAYNAGPGNVSRWLNASKGTFDAMTFVEAIPFTETREYVQAVLSYRVIYQHGKQQSVPMMNQQEINFNY